MQWVLCMNITNAMGFVYEHYLCNVGHGFFV